MLGGAKAFRKKAARFWSIGPMPQPTGEIHRVVFVDGIYLARNIVVLIAKGEKHALSWYRENLQAWAALMSHIAPPDMAVADGETGFERARRAVWPKTKAKRCVFHVFC
jgi:transposase-like protein